jgi:hypothetical protein
VGLALCAAWLGLGACSPSGDLDQHARGDGSLSSDTGGAAGVTPPGAPAEQLPASVPPGEMTGASVSTEGGESLPVAPLDPGIEPALGALDASAPPPPPAPGEDAGVPPEQPPVEDPGVVEPIVPAPALPDDLRNAPVAGEITFSDEAEWEVDGVFEPTFEIHTPTGSYWVVKPLGTIVSIEDGTDTAEQWIAFSSGFRPLRGVPSFATPPATRVTTVRDQDSQTPTHLRLTAASDDDQWQWVWDFYVTHVTFTINRAPLPFGFGYQGVPGGVLGAEDQLVTSAGEAQGARSSFNADLPGPVEWAYLADTTLGRSLFAIQHGDDAVAERYVVRDSDTSLLLFGNGQLQRLPMRFSLGLIPSVQHPALTQRVDFVIQAIPPAP